jgi:serine/threonine protein kinase
MFYENQKIGSYILISRLGKGGFGEVWLAEKRSQFVTKKVAVKLPLDEQINFDAIRQEAMLWEQASGHANVLPIIDADVYDGQVVIVSEYADGGSLYDRLKAEGKFPVNEAVETTVGILNGLEFLHNKRIIHRDIKPQNILLQGNTPRLADFGISRAMNTAAISSAIIGTDAYMSPEAFDGKRSVQSDVWAVGVVLYQLLKGSLPFAQEHPSERMFAILQKEFEPLPNEVPESLQVIVANALAKLPENRYASAGAMRDDLQKFLRGEKVSSLIRFSSPAVFPPAIPPAAPVSQTAQTVRLPVSQNFHGENETVLRPVSHAVPGKLRRGLNPVFYPLIFLLLCAAAGSIYYFFVYQSRQKFLANTPQVKTAPAANNNAVSAQNANTANANAAVNVNSGPPPLDAPHIKAEYRVVLQKWLENKAGWRPATVNDVYYGLDKDQREYAKGEMQSNGKFQHPYYVVDDFNSDGKQDFALVLITTNRKKYAVAIFNAPFGDSPSPTYYTEELGKGDWLFWMKDDGFQKRFIVGPPASDAGYLIVPRGNSYVVESGGADEN